MEGSLTERFWGNVQKSAGCWLWTAGTFTSGYGQLRVGSQKKKAHRLSWELHNGSIPDGLCVCHRCDTPTCVRPDHLFLGTPADNRSDCIQKGRARYASGENHYKAKLTDDDVREIHRLYDIGGSTQLKIAGQFGVARTFISRVLSGARRTAANNVLGNSAHG